MAHMIQILFNYQNDFYSAFVTIINEFDTDFTDIEFLDQDMIDIVHSPCLSYFGEEYKKLFIYRHSPTRMLFNNIYEVIQHAQYVCKNEHAGKILDEEYIRRN